MLISGAGRNLKAIIRACEDGRIAGRIVGVLSDRADAPGLQFARRAGIESRVVLASGFSDRSQFDAALLETLDAWAPDMVVLAGFMRILGADFVQRYRGRLLNIHPSLLPHYPGLRTHQRVLENGDAEHGATVHFVTEELDGGPAIIQGRLMVDPQDTEQTLAERVMQQIELRIYPQAVAWMANGALRLGENGPELNGRTLKSPRGLADLQEGF